MNAKCIILTTVVAVLTSSWTCAVADVTIADIEPTPLFPRQSEGQSLKQLARLQVENHGEAFAASVRVTLETNAPDKQTVAVAKGKAAVNILVPDVATPTPLFVELLAQDGAVLAAKTLAWKPQKKWMIYCCSYSHQDLGFGDYPHRLRTSIRHENIRLPLQFCRETDGWPDESKYRFNIETSEPITSFISFHGKGAARELARRIREGRIELGRLHNTANTEELSRELLARLFYMSGRYAVDLLGIPPQKTMQNDDVIGQTWPLATYAAEAGVSYFFHGFNGCGHCERPAESEMAFYWQGPDAHSRVMEHATPYGGYAGDGPGDGSVAYILKSIDRLGASNPYDVLLLQEGTDFKLTTRHFANQIHAWNEKWAYPRMVCATMDMFFDALAKEAAIVKTKTFAGDSNNQWSDQDYAAARATGQARRLTEELPATETLATVAQALAGGNDQWINLFQGYHRLLQYFEHTNAKDSPYGNMIWYETELEENREMVREAAGYQQQVFANATRRLSAVITRKGSKNLVVFNSLPYPRTDIVRAEIPAESVVDSVTGAKTPVQQLPDGTAVFVARDVPATGYKVYSLIGEPCGIVPEAARILENDFYRLSIHPATGTVASLFDKTLGVELVDTTAPNGLNEYLYEYRKSAGNPNFDSVWSRMEKADSVSLERGPVADVLTVTGKAGGVRALKQTVMLYHDLSRVDFGIWMDKAPFRGIRGFSSEHEAVFIALPFSIPHFAIHHELPGAVIEPYKQQFAGSATDHYAIRSFADLSNDKYGVTVSPVEGSLVCYGAPTSAPMFGGFYSNFKRDRTYPVTSRLYLYLLNNMFSCNIGVDQRGPVSFRWSLRSHAGDWKTGGADRFGRTVQQPLLAWRADGEHAGLLPPSASFMGIEAPNVMCSVVKPAEANGRGFILRLNETTGKETMATVSLPLLPPVESVVETSLVEDDRATIGKGNTFQVTLRPFGVKTIRVICAGSPISVTDLNARAAADMQVDLTWKCETSPSLQPSLGGQARPRFSHFNVYRDTERACPATQLNFIGQSVTSSFVDRPRVNLGGWLRSCLAPKTTYYYRVVPVDRANNSGTPSAVAMITTPSSEEANLLPVAVEGLRVILVSPITHDNFVNLLFRTACEPDVAHYEVYRDAALVGVVRSDDIPPRSGGYGESNILYQVKEYDHATFTDKTVEPGTTYRYKVRAVDTAGQKGAFSDEVCITTKGIPFKTTAQSIYAPEYGPELAVDGDPHPYRAWISKPYGGGPKDKPLDVWWAIEFPKKPVTIKGVKIIGDHRDVIPLQKSLQVQTRQSGAWKTIGECKAAAGKDITITFPQPTTTNTLRVFVAASDLPRSDRTDVDGIVRIAELLVITPEGRERTVVEAMNR